MKKLISMLSLKIKSLVAGPAVCFWLFGAISPLIAADTIETAPPASVSAFAPATVISGNTARQRGIAYGKHFKDGIHQFLEQEIFDALGGKTSKEEMLKYAAACGKVTQELCPMVAEEIAGIAEGAGLSYEEIILIHAHEELYHRNALPKVAEGHCTAVAVSPSDSGDGHGYVGQTWDWMTRLAGVSSVTLWRRGDAPDVLAYGYPGMPMGAGLNSAGLALCWTSGGSPPQKDTSSPRIGLPSYVLIEHLLAQKDIASVVREAERDRHAGWFTMVVADDKGNLVNIEGSPQGVAIERSSDRMARAYYATRKLTGASEGQPAKLHPRCERMYKLLEKTAGKNDLKTIESYFTGREHGIMGWQNPKNKTIDAMVFDTTARKAYLTRGAAYGVDWREYSFQAK